MHCTGRKSGAAVSVRRPPPSYRGESRWPVPATWACPGSAPAASSSGPSRATGPIPTDADALTEVARDPPGRQLARAVRGRDRVHPLQRLLPLRPGPRHHLPVGAVPDRFGRPAGRRSTSTPTSPWPGARPGRVGRDHPGGPAPGDDQVVRHQLPLPRPRARPHHRVRPVLHQAGGRVHRGPGPRDRAPGPSSSAPSPISGWPRPRSPASPPWSSSRPCSTSTAGSSTPWWRRGPAGSSSTNRSSAPTSTTRPGRPSTSPTPSSGPPARLSSSWPPTSPAWPQPGPGHRPPGGRPPRRPGPRSRATPGSPRPSRPPTPSSRPGWSTAATSGATTSPCTSEYWAAACLGPLMFAPGGLCRQPAVHPPGRPGLPGHVRREWPGSRRARSPGPCLRRSRLRQDAPASCRPGLGLVRGGPGDR